MHKVTFIISILITLNIQIALCQKKIELKSYPNKEYNVSDSLIYFANDLQDTVEKIWLSIDIMEDKEWEEYDNDIYMKEPRSFKYFILKKSKEKRFIFYLRDLDSTLKNTSNIKLRIVLNTYPTRLRGSMKYPFQEFTLKK